MEQLLLLDGNILIYIQEHIRNAFLNPIMIGITHLGDSGICWILLAVILLAHARSRKAGLRIACALVCMFLINDVCLKNLIARVRPYEVVPGLVNIIGAQQDFSFPSGHTAVSFASAAALWKGTSGPGRTGLLVLACLIAISRLYVGVHYPTDVLGGIVSGIVSGCLGGWIADKYLQDDFWKAGKKKGKQR